MQRLSQSRVSFAQANTGIYWTLPWNRPGNNFTWVSAAGNNQKIRGKTVLVAGATGGVGSQVVQCLCNEGAKVRALVRDYTKVVWPFNLLVLLLGTSKCLSRLTLVTLVFACVTGLEVSMNSRCVVLCRTRICTHRTWRFSRAMFTST